VVAGFADASGNYLPLIATLNAARVLDKTRDVLAVDFEGFEHLALAGEPASAGLVMIPYFEGERTPNLPFATASLHGLSLASFSRENLARASVEGVLCALADGLDAITAQGVTPRRIMLIGGSANNKAVAQCAREIFEHPTELPEPAEYVALGATVQAAWALSGQRPVWPVKTHPLGQPQFNPDIRKNYARYRTQVHPEAFASEEEPVA
jgi:xylulokinase